jgi:hypothetical protein
MSAGETNEPASKVNVRRDKRTKIAMDVLLSEANLKAYTASPIHW